jgi:Protein of unknown function (DUF3828)
MSRTLFFGVLIAAFLMLTGCKSDSAAIKNRAQDFLVALDAGNKADLDLVLTKKAKEQPLGQSLIDISKKGNDDRNGRSNSSHTLGEVAIEKDTATVAVTLKDDKGETTPGTVHLRREEGDWKVYALTVIIKGNTIMLDFENPERVISDIFQAAGKEMGKASKEMDRAATAFAKGMEGFAKGMSEGLKENK